MSIYVHSIYKYILIIFNTFCLYCTVKGRSHTNTTPWHLPPVELNQSKAQKVTPKVLQRVWKGFFENTNKNDGSWGKAHSLTSSKDLFMVT